MFAFCSRLSYFLCVILLLNHFCLRVIDSLFSTFFILHVDRALFSTLFRFCDISFVFFFAARSLLIYIYIFCNFFGVWKTEYFVSVVKYFL